MRYIFTCAAMMFISFLHAQTANLVWAKQLGGPKDDSGNYIAVDASGNVYTTGFFVGTADFDPGPGIYNLTSAGFRDAFVTKFNASGNLVWAKQMGGTGNCIALDANGNILITGYFQGTADFDPGPGTFNLTSSVNTNDIFICKLDSLGNFVWAKNIGVIVNGSGNTSNSLGVDATGNVYITGYFTGTTDFDPDKSSLFYLTTTGIGNNDIFILKLSTSGNFVWAKQIGGTSYEVGNSIVLDPFGNIYVTGSFRLTVDFDPGPGFYYLTAAGNSAQFVIKLDNLGNLVWAQNMGGTGSTIGNSIALDISGNVYTTGYYVGTADFDPGPGTYDLVSNNGSLDIFILKLDALGNFIWAKTIGAGAVDVGNSITLDAYSNVYTTGYSTDNGAYISKSNASGDLIWYKQIGARSDRGNSIIVDAASNIYATGYFKGTSDFDPGAGTYNLIKPDDIDLFVLKISQADYFRTTTTGYWNDINTWESSINNNNWYPATLTPEFNSKLIVIRNPNILTVTSDVTIDQTTINSGGAVIVSPAANLIINDGEGFDIVVNGALTVQTGGRMIIKSTAAGTGSIGTSSGSVVGNVIVERFISSLFAKSAWRLLTAPLKSTSTNGTIFSNWQSGGVNISGRGTKITGPAYNGSNGLDANFAEPSMKWWDVATQTLQPVNTTNNTAITPLFTSAAFAANQSYFIFIDGDRLATSVSPNTTTISASGNLQMGDQTFALRPISNAFNLIGNPYASSVDLNQLRLDNTGSNVKSTYYYWDPYLTGAAGYGGYVTVSYDGSGNETIIPAGADHTRFLLSGQAMYVQTNTSAAAALVFKEAQKNASTINSIFRTSSGAIENITIILRVLSAGIPILIDGIVTSFDKIYNSAIDQYDAVKLYNTGESIAFMRNGSGLSIERRPLIKSDDVLYLNLANLKAGKDYQLEIKPSVNIAGLTAYLVDNYLKTTTPIDLNKSTIIGFAINTYAASTGVNRFNIIFSKPIVAQSSKSSIAVYPNPVTNGIISLQFSNMPQGVYKVRVLNNIGQTVVTKQINHSTSNNLETIQLEKSMKGLFHLEIRNPDNTKFSKNIITN